MTASRNFRGQAVLPYGRAEACTGGGHFYCHDPMIENAVTSKRDVIRALSPIRN
jgi:hypothetical protein